jgi:hypothetical protein
MIIRLDLEFQLVIAMDDSADLSLEVNLGLDVVEHENCCTSFTAGPCPVDAPHPFHSQSCCDTFQQRGVAFCLDLARYQSCCISRGSFLQETYSSSVVHTFQIA